MLRLQRDWIFSFLRATSLGWLLVAGWLFCPTSHVRAAGEDLQAKYFNGLRQRRLFELAESYCRDRLERSDLVPEERLKLTIELARTLADHAAHATEATQRETLWNQARQTVAELLEADPQSPQRLLLVFHAAALDASQGQSLRYHVQLMPYDTVLRERAVSLLSAAVEQFRQLHKEIEQDIPAAKTREEQEFLLTEGELQILEVHADDRLSTALIDLGTILPDKSPERATVLLDAEKILRDPMKESSKGSHRHLMLAECLRLGGRYDEALEQLSLFSRPGTNSATSDRAAAERIRVLLEMKKPEEAAKVIDDFVVAERKLSAELAFLDVRILAVQREKALRDGDTGAAEPLLTLLSARVEKVEQEYGGYWGARAKMTLDLARESASLGEDLALSIRSARSLYAHGKLIPAIEMYRLAAAAAYKAGNPDLAFDLAFTHASLQLKVKQFATAGRGFQELIDRFPENPRVGRASLLHAYALGQIYHARRTKSHREAYTAALEAHRKKFASDETAATATWMLAQLEEQRLQTSVALKLYQSIPHTHPRGPAAQIAVARCHEKILNRLRSLKRPLEPFRQQAIDELTALLPAATEPRPSLNETQARVATHLARIYLSDEDPEFSLADDLLAWVFSSQPTTETKSKPIADGYQRTLAAAAQLRVVSLAGQNRLSEASELLTQLSVTSPMEMLVVLDGISQLVEDSGEEMRSAMGRLQLQAVDRLQQRRGELDDDQQMRLDRCRAQAFLATGQIEEADELYGQLRERRPRNRGLITSHAKVLLACGTRRCLRRALQLWRAIEKSHKSGTRPWIEARYYHALCQFRLEDYDQCRKLLGIASQLYPELGSPELQSRYQELSKECEAALKP